MAQLSLARCHNCHSRTTHMTFCQSHYTFRHNTMTCQIKQPHLSAGLLLQPNIPRNIIASLASAGILLYTRIYTTVIARSVATWQSHTIPPSLRGAPRRGNLHPSLRGAQRRGNHPLSLPRVHGLQKHPPQPQLVGIPHFKGASRFA